MHIVILMPVYDDWESAGVLSQALNDALRNHSQLSTTLLLVDDGSNQAPPRSFPGSLLPFIQSARILRLRRNLGHQRAIAVALAYIEQHLPGDAILVMDADGEDHPEDILRLIDAFENAEGKVTVFARRGRRVESLGFKLFYTCYRALHWLLTGRKIKFGNFSLMPRPHLSRIVAYPELWNHYAAAMLKARLPYISIRVDRGKRLRGDSKMNFVSLVIHGLSALFASYEVVSTRLLMGTALLALAFCCLMGTVVWVKVFTPLAIPGWATFTFGLLFILVVQAAAALLTITFSVMMSRNTLGFLPIRDYEHFVQECVTLSPL